MSPSFRQRRKTSGTSFTNHNEQNDFYQQNNSKRRHTYNKELTSLSDLTKTLDPNFEMMVVSIESKLKMYFTETLKQVHDAANYFYLSLMNDTQKDQTTTIAATSLPTFFTSPSPLSTPTELSTTPAPATTSTTTGTTEIPTAITPTYHTTPFTTPSLDTVRQTRKTSPRPEELVNNNPNSF